jgi:hypothetical protein
VIRHPNRRVGLAGNQPVQCARGARPGDDHGPVLGTLHDMLIAIGSEAALLEADSAFRVTLDAMAFQDGLNIRMEGDLLVGRASSQGYANAQNHGSETSPQRTYRKFSRSADSHD